MPGMGAQVISGKCWPHFFRRQAQPSITNWRCNLWFP